MTEGARKRDLPWIIATAVLGVGLLVSLAYLFFGGDDESGVPDDAETVTTVGDDGGDVAAGGADGFVSSAQPLEVFSIVVDNAPGGRPQIGLGEGTLLVEYPVEGGITRFIAVIPADTPGLVGPVRSLRPVNSSLAPVLGSTLIASGAQPDVTRSVVATGVTLMTPIEVPSFVSLGRGRPHDTFVDLDDLTTFFVPSAQTLGFPFGGDLPQAAGQATRVVMPYPGVAFDFDAGTGYVREQDGAPMEVLDSLSAGTSALAHDTVVILYVAERAAGYTDSNGIEVFDFDVVGSGDLVVLHDGDVIEGTWSRSAVADPYVFRGASGETFGLPEGRTYVAIVSRDERAELN